MIRTIVFPALAIACAVAVIPACGGSRTSNFLGDPTSGNDAAAAPDGSLVPGPFAGSLPDASTDSSLGKACERDEDCGQGGLCDPQAKACSCGGSAVAATRIPSNVLLVLDRSCSMNGKVGNDSKWQIAVRALGRLTDSYAQRMNLGLALFPDTTGNNCTQDAIAIPVGPNNAAKIKALLNAALSTSDPNYPDGPCVTNIDTAMQQAATEPSFGDKTKKRFSLLITDGAQSTGCSSGGGDNGTEKTIADMRKNGVGTFVLAFGSGSVDGPALTKFANAGGHPNQSGSTPYYLAENETQLDVELQKVIGVAQSCDVKLAAPPPNGNADLIFVYLDNVPPPVPRDPAHREGWDYDAATEEVRFFGSACERIQTGKVTDVRVVFGCPGGPPPPPR